MIILHDVHTYTRTLLIDYCRTKNHSQMQCHKESTTSAKMFEDTLTLKKKNVLEQIDTAYNRVIENNRKKIIPIIKTLIYCGTHDIAIYEENVLMKEILLIY